jgi:hypothetical protein
LRNSNDHSTSSIIPYCTAQTQRRTNEDNLFHPPKPNSRIFFEKATPGGNKFLVAAGVDSKPEMLGTIVEPILTLFSLWTSAERIILHAKFQKSN